MDIIGIIILIVLIVSAIKLILEKAGEFAGVIIQIIAAIGLLVGAFFLLKFLFKIAVKALHFLLCLIPNWFIYGYSAIFLAFIILWFFMCILNVNLSMVVEYELCTVPMIGTEKEIFSLLKDNLEQHTSGITRIMTRMRINCPVCFNMIRDNCVRISSGFCTFAVISELSNVLSEEGMDTDEELISALENRRTVISEELYSLKDQVEDIKVCCRKLQSRGEIKTIDIPYGSNDGECVKKRIYCSTRPNPNPVNMLPPIHLELD